MEVRKTKVEQISTRHTRERRCDIWVATPPATSRHTSRLLRLLPSGPDRVHKVSLREDQWSHHCVCPNDSTDTQQGIKQNF